MTFSVGMRAPSQAELTGDLADYLAERLDESQRYTDPDLAPARSTGEIDAAALERLRIALPFASALDEESLRDWFGRFITRYRNAQTPATPARPMTLAALRKRLDGGATLLRHPWSRLAWSRGRRAVVLFANGHAYAAPTDLARRLCAERSLAFDDAPGDEAMALLLTLVNDGHLVPHKGRR
jgi:50S ribosomal protein L16 3-hydroxylase